MTGKRIGYNPLNTIPRDIVAKRVVYDDGDHYDPKIKSNKHLYSTSPLPMKLIPSRIKKDPNFKDMTGSVYGNFTVIGLFDCDGFNKWVLRCCCGNYEVRTAKTLNKISGKIDETRCQSCLDTERLRNRDYWQKHGLYPWQVAK